MCAPGLQLTLRERYMLGAYEPIAVESLDGRRCNIPVTRHSAQYDGTGIAMNMRRLERILTRVEPISTAQSMATEPSTIALMRQSQEFGVFASINGIWERRDTTAIMLPKHYRMACMIMNNQAFLLTVGPTFQRSIQKKYGDSPTVKYYTDVFCAHGFDPRAPLLIRSKVEPITTVKWKGDICA